MQMRRIRALAVVSSIVALAATARADTPLPQALQVLGNVHGSFAVDGLAARIRMEKAGPDGLAPAFAALDAKDIDRALDILISAIRPSAPTRDDIRRIVVGVLAELDENDPRLLTARQRLASALY